MKKKMYIVLVGVWVSFVVKGQMQFNLSQYMVHQPFVNPASMIGLEKTNVALFHRSQWVGFENSPVVNGVNYNTIIHNKSRIGGTFIYDKIGVNNFYETSFDYSYSLFETSFSSLAFGTNFSLKMIQSNYADLNTVVINDPLYSENTPVLIAPNGRFGVYFIRKQFYLGGVLRNLVHNKVAVNSSSQIVSNQINPNKIHFYVHGGNKFLFNPTMYITFSGLGKYIKNSPLQAELTSILGFKNKLAFGVTYRSNNDFVAIVQLPFAQKFMLSYSYDMSLSKVRKFLSGTHELLFIIKAPNSKSKPINPSIRF